VVLQVEVPAVALVARVQLAAGEKVPVEFEAKVTVPVGVIMVPAEVSVTVAVQLVPWLTTTEDGVQAILVEVVRGVTVKVKAVVVVLAAWVASPP